MASIDVTLDLEVPVRTAYNQWTQFEDFPVFMRGILAVTQIDTRHVHWHAEMGGKTLEWDAEIVEQIPDRRIVWKSVSGEPNEGSVNFEPIGAHGCRLQLHLEYQPRGTLAALADHLGVVRRQTAQNLRSFKRFIERRGVETGAFRGKIPRPA